MNDSKGILRTIVGLIVAYFLSLFLKAKGANALMASLVGGVGGKLVAEAIV